jgi:hypothetical protein
MHWGEEEGHMTKIIAALAILLGATSTVLAQSQSGSSYGTPPGGAADTGTHSQGSTGQTSQSSQSNGR